MIPGKLRVSVVMPAHNEDRQIRPVLDRLFEAISLPREVLAVVDSDDDTTVPVVGEYAQIEPRLRRLVNTYYATDFVHQVGIESRHGFEIGIELTAKARRMRLPVAEIPRSLAGFRAKGT